MRAAFFSMQALIPQQHEVFASRWLRARKQVHKQQRRALDFVDLVGRFGERGT
jgi:hypothetical protein